MRYGSICSGIEAATAAWHPLGWRPSFFSEIEAFPRAVLTHHYSEVPLHGDFTTIEAGQYEPIELLVGGTPCQSFSVAGLRGGLADDRGNLALEFLRLAQRLRPRWLVWENVPGVLSSNGGRDFGAILGGLVELGYGFAYRVLDAQYFGVPQRRRRVFVVGYLGDWRRAAAVLFERHSMSGNPPPRREAGEGTPKSTTGSLNTSIARGTGQGHEADFLIAPPLPFDPRQIHHPANHSRPKTGDPYGDHESREGLLVAFGGNNTSGPIDIATAVNAHGGPHGRQDFESETFVTHSLRADGFDASEDGTGRGTLLVPTFRDWHAATKDLGGSRVEYDRIYGEPVAMNLRGRDGGAMPELADTASLRAASGGSSRSYVAFSSKDHGADAGDLASTLRAMGHAGSHANAGGQVAVAMVNCNSTPEVSFDVAMPLRSNDGSGNRQGFQSGSAVRRLTPAECEKLQGFPPGYTLVPHRGKPAADGPRYKALGNSMAVPVMAWIGERIDMVEALSAELAAADRAGRADDDEAAVRSG